MAEESKEGPRILEAGGWQVRLPPGANPHLSVRRAGGGFLNLLLETHDLEKILAAQDANARSEYSPGEGMRFCISADVVEASTYVVTAGFEVGFGHAASGTGTALVALLREALVVMQEPAAAS